jgi:hypothetical protein
MKFRRGVQEEVQVNAKEEVQIEVKEEVRVLELRKSSGKGSE